MSPEMIVILNDVRMHTFMTGVRKFIISLGTQEIVEHSEEIRLSLVALLTSIVTISASGIAPYLSDLITILQRTLIDPYPEVKKVHTCANS